jgi:RES domain-containing protein
MIVYRIGSSRHPANDGLGASLAGGRWNHVGTPVIYTAESVALCALEVMANDADLAGDYICISIEVPDDVLITSISIAASPTGWNSHPYSAATQDIGTSWAKGLLTAVLSVPSVVIPRERNYILNPTHPDFSRISFSAAPFTFDERLRR